MPRPQRIEYENAFYHVMNRGRARQTIFHDEEYYRDFLETLREVHQRFGCVIHGYCLMGNHYHLLLETPLANLGRIMRHVNGVYTQRYNRRKKIDGPLFRGRYKAILVDGDAYFLQLSRYIHRNPIDVRKPLVAALEDYFYSSYPSYVGKQKAPEWLERKMIYRMLGHKQRYKGYADYVMSGVDEETQGFYNKGNLSSVMGDEDFRAWLYEEQLPSLAAEEKSRVVFPAISLEEVINQVAKFYGVEVNDITRKKMGPQKSREERNVAMHLCQELTQSSLQEISDKFGLSSAGSVSFATCQVRKRRGSESDFERKMIKVVDSIIIQVT